MISESAKPSSLVVLKHRPWLILLVALPFALAFSAYVAFSPPQYETSTTVSFAPRRNQQIGGDVIKVILPRYVALLSAPITTEAIATRVGAPRQVLEQAVVAVGVDSANLTIEVRDTDPVRGAAAANALADVAVAAARGDELLQGEQVALALPARHPAGLPRIVYFAIGALASLVAGCAVALLVQRFRPRIYELSEGSAIAQMPGLGRVPLIKSLKVGRTTARDDPILAESMQAVLTHVDRVASAPAAKVVGFTSPSYGHGKTSLALAYAGRAADRGRRVLLIDADLARAKVTALTLAKTTGAGGQTPGPAGGNGGLLAVLQGDEQYQDVLVPGPDGVSVLPTATSARALDSIRLLFPSLVEEVLTNFDQVVVDCAPLNRHEGSLVTSQLPFVVLVVSKGSLESEVASGVYELGHVGRGAVGLVLNRSGRGPRSTASEF